ncbi:hypothetical protein [Amycolatopsis sp. lyj-112]|uniref:hypothetical protein n=1 Tax=Amycolatopsis sp. lyj-112 TaxID=2789288 RepID=UPI003979074E
MTNARVYVSFPVELADAFRITTKHHNTKTIIGLETDSIEDLEILAGSLDTLKTAVAIRLEELERGAA